MKNNFLKLLCLITLTYISISCSSDNEPNTKEDYKFSVEKADHTINWTAYKTTDKTPVLGRFNSLEITSGGKGNTIEETLNNCAFEIPVSSLDTDDVLRNHNILNYFFLKMIETQNITGSITINSDSEGTFTLTINNQTNKIPFTYAIASNTVTITSSLKMSNWNIAKALETLNTKCKLLHMGSDGIVKVWDEVPISIQLKF